jgi:Galactose oxidase, central domain
MNTWQRITLACLSMLVLGLAPIGAALAQVKVTAATPSSAYQGTSLDVVVSGSGFDKTAKAQYFVTGTTNPGGITVTQVVFRKSTEIVTTVNVADGAVLANFDIQVTLSSGRKGKGTTLFSVKAKPNDPPPPPTYPAARAWHSFTANGGGDVATSRLYMYGGAGANANVVPNDLWYYGAFADKWTLVTPSGTAMPGSRQWEGLSCGAGACVMEAGSNGVGLVNETWVYSGATNAWTQASCGRTSPCPSARMMMTMAFDPDRGNHLLFGGKGSQSPGLNDTWTFDAATLKWTLRVPTLKPAERNRAAAAYVPGVGVVMYGGQDYYGRAPLCDLFVWNGSNWRSIQFDVNQPHPCLHTHSMSWDGQGLVVTGGYVDTSDTPNLVPWRFTLATGALAGVWSQASSGVCLPILGTDAMIHPGAKMAYDISTATRVWFGGEENINGAAVRYGNTVECQ